MFSSACVAIIMMAQSVSQLIWENRHEGVNYSNLLHIELLFNIYIHLHNNTGSRRRRTTTVRSNDTLVDTPFQLISGFFHVNQGALCCAGGQQAC